jgi:glycosyltransferase involved in cell wall biosynthesis
MADGSNQNHTKPLRVLFHINDFGKGGTETSLLSWLDALDRSLFSPGVSVAYPTDELSFWRQQRFPNDVSVHVLSPARWMYGLHEAGRHKRLSKGLKLAHKLLTYTVIRPLASLRFRRIARDYDLICDFDLSLRHIAGSGNVPWFGVSHFSIATRLAKKKPHYIARRSKQLSRYGAIAVLTPDMLREAQAVFATTPLNLVELPNVIDVERIRQDAREVVAKPAERFIASVARLDEGQKDHQTLIRAYAQLRQQSLISADLVLIGEGRDRNSLERLVAELGVADSVHFLGFQANPFPYIRHAEMLVLSSRYEGFGMVLGEAMALGTPVISTDCPTGPRDLLDGGSAGLLVPLSDVAAMAQAIERLCNDTGLREKLRQRGLQKVATFAPASANERMLELATLVSE